MFDFGRNRRTTEEKTTRPTRPNKKKNTHTNNLQSNNLPDRLLFQISTMREVFNTYQYFSGAAVSASFNTFQYIYIYISVYISLYLSVYIYIYYYYFYFIGFSDEEFLALAACARTGRPALVSPRDHAHLGQTSGQSSARGLRRSERSKTKAAGKPLATTLATDRRKPPYSNKWTRRLTLVRSRYGLGARPHPTPPPTRQVGKWTF